MADSPKALSLRARRAIACAGILVFVIVYIMVASDIGRHLPNNPLIQLLFYALAGTLWGVPVIPLISWSEAYRRKK